MKNIKIQVPKKHLNKKNELNKMIEKYHPVLLLEKFTGRKWDKELIIRHKSLGLEASWNKKNEVLVDFKNDVSYIWLSVCHELAHLILRSPAWHNNKQIKKTITQHDSYRSTKYHYNFCYAIEQTLAFFLQAACENKADLRKLKWEAWENTFEANDVSKFARKLWEDWLIYLKNISSYKDIDQWIIKMLEKHW